MKAQVWSRSIKPLILNLGTRCRWLVNFMSRSLCPREETLAHIDKENGWAPDQVWTFWIRISYRLLRSWVSVRLFLSRLTSSTSNSDIWYEFSLVLQGRNAAIFLQFIFLQGRNAAIFLQFIFFYKDETQLFSFNLYFFTRTKRSYFPSIYFFYKNETQLFSFNLFFLHGRNAAIFLQFIFFKRTKRSYFPSIYFFYKDETQLFYFNLFFLQGRNAAIFLQFIFFTRKKYVCRLSDVRETFLFSLPSLISINSLR